MGVEKDDIIEAFSAIDASRREESKAEQERAFEESVEATYAFVVQEVRTKLKDKVRSLVQHNASLVDRSVDFYCDQVFRVVQQHIEQSPCVPLTVDFDRYYLKLQRINDRTKLLEALQKVIDRGQEALNRLPALDPTDAYRSGSVVLVEELKKLEGVKVIAPTEDDDELRGSEKDRVDALRGSVEDDQKQLDETLESILDETMVDLAHPDESFKDSLQDVETRVEQIEGKIDLTTDAFDQLLLDRARSVSGKSMNLDELEPFSGEVSVSGAVDLDELGVLVKELVAAFDVYGKVLHDQGVFAAFLQGVPCESFGYSNTQQGGCAQILEELEQEPGGDPLPVVIERMKEFNAKPYFGILDDGFSDHVTGFWYGYAEFGRFLKEASELNKAEFSSYLRCNKEVVLAQANRLGLFMNDEQLATYCDEVGVLEERLDTDGIDRR